MQPKEGSGDQGQDEGASNALGQLGKNECPPIILLEEGMDEGYKDGHEPIIGKQAEGADFVQYWQGVNVSLQENIIAGGIEMSAAECIDCSITR